MMIHSVLVSSASCLFSVSPHGAVSFVQIRTPPPPPPLGLNSSSSSSSAVQHAWQHCIGTAARGRKKDERSTRRCGVAMLPSTAAGYLSPSCRDPVKQGKVVSTLVAASGIADLCVHEVLPGLAIEDRLAGAWLRKGIVRDPGTFGTVTPSRAPEGPCRCSWL